MLKLFLQTEQFRYCKIKTFFNKISSNCVLFALVGILSALSFVHIYGFHILNPTYTDWLLNKGDLSQHYLGWVAFRSSDWSFPIGLTDMLAYPNSTSVIFTDSIPIFAGVFKILSPLLPVEFQYFGLWGITCFILQGILSARIIRNFTENKFVIVLSGVLLVYAPVMIYRMYMHTALAGQWILLLILEPFFAYTKNSYDLNKKIYKIVFLTGILASSIHMYFIPMCGIIIIGICMEDVLLNKRIKRSILLIIDYAVTCSIMIWLLGGFSSYGTTFSAGGLGHFSMNLNTLFNSQNWSCIFLNLDLYTEGQKEGFGYLGAGSLLLLLFGFLFWICRFNERKMFRQHKEQFISVLGIILISSFVALSPKVSCNGKLLYELLLPELIKKIWGVFRSSGRFVMIIIYVLIINIVIVLIKYIPKKILSIIIAICLILQIYDLHFVISQKNEYFNQIVEYQSPLKEDETIWTAIGDNSKIKHVIVTYWADNQYYTLAEWALSYGMTLSSFAMAHPRTNSLLKGVNNYLENPQMDEIFIFENDKDKLNMLEYDLNYYQTDEFIIGYFGEIKNFSPMGR